MRDHYDFSQAKRGPVIPSPGKTRITIMLDDDVIEFFRARAEAAGTGYQTLINATLRAAIAEERGEASTVQPRRFDSLAEFFADPETVLPEEFEIPDDPPAEPFDLL